MLTPSELKELSAIRDRIRDLPTATKAEMLMKHALEDSLSAVMSIGVGSVGLAPGDLRSADSALKRAVALL